MSKKVYKLRPDTEDLRDKVYRSTQFKTQAAIPKSMDLRFACSSIVDQETLGSCTANAIASGLREYWDKCASKSGSYTPLSRLWLYWEERNLEGTVNEDAGGMIRDGMKILQQQGCAIEADWPYDIENFAKTPPAAAYIQAAQFKISEYHRINDLTALKTALAEGYPVVMGIEVYESFESDQVAKTGIIPMPKKGEELLGFHAVLAVGYKDDGKNKGQGIVFGRNSWGENWGDKGYFYLPYGYFTKYVIDMWTGK